MRGEMGNAVLGWAAIFQQQFHIMEEKARILVGLSWPLPEVGNRNRTKGLEAVTLSLIYALE